MEYPIFERLKAGDRFPYSLLAVSYEETEMYWDWWWNTQARNDVLSRPVTIADDDPILEPATIEKATVDTLDRDAFYAFAEKPLIQGKLPVGVDIPRASYREAIVDYLASLIPVLPTKSAVFLGGGYGAGKSTTLNVLCADELLPLKQWQRVGVDACKMFIPEFHRVRMASDGRASTVTQAESRLISDHLLRSLLQAGKSFAWDSSMSDLGPTMERVRAVKAAGYTVHLVGVYTRPEIAIRRAMLRAKETRRFAHPSKLLPSAIGFAKHFPAFADEFDKVWLFTNNFDNADPVLIAEKERVDSEVEVFDNSAFDEFTELGRKQ